MLPEKVRLRESARRNVRLGLLCMRFGKRDECNGWDQTRRILLIDEECIGTLDNPIIVKSFGDEQYAGCTGYPVDSHVTIWLTVRLTTPSFFSFHRSLFSTDSSPDVPRPPR